MALPISLFILGAFYYWFAVANRYVVFLYGHIAKGIPRTEPFDELTSSRYWMSGLVISGAVMVIYTGFNWALGRVGDRSQRGYCPPPWWQVWVLCAIPLIFGIPSITMTVNSPTLPPLLAVACVGMTLVGLVLALLPGSWAAQYPHDLLWLVIDGAGLMPILLLLRVIELPNRGLISKPMAIVFALGSILTAIGWLGVMTGFRVWRRKSLPDAGMLFTAGLGLSYLLLPLLHYLLASKPAYRYISAASNFFAFDIGLQVLIFIISAGIAIGVTQIRRRLIPWLVSRQELF